MKKAFTLIELLVVISIISILAAILFPVFAQAKLAAKNTQDMSNIRQVNFALSMYTTDNSDVYTPVGSWNDPTVTVYNTPSKNDWNGWGVKLLAYTKSADVFVSPFMPKKATWWTGPCASSNGMTITSTYSYNWFLGADDSYMDSTPGVYYNYSPNGEAFATPTSHTSIPQPSNTIAFMLSQTTSPYGNDFGCSYNTLESPDWDNKVRFRAMYNSGGNIAFTDNHTKFLKAKEADSAGQGYPNCNGAPSHTIYIWKSRNIWAYPYYPSRNGGFNEEPVAESCASTSS